MNGLTPRAPVSITTAFLSMHSLSYIVKFLCNMPSSLLSICDEFSCYIKKENSKRYFSVLSSIHLKIKTAIKTYIFFIYDHLQVVFPNEFYTLLPSFNSLPPRIILQFCEFNLLIVTSGFYYIYIIFKYNLTFKNTISIHFIFFNITFILTYKKHWHMPMLFHYLF